MSRWSLAAAAGLVAAVLLALPAAASAGPAAVARADAALVRALRAVVARPQGPPGASALVQRGSVRRFFTVGLGDVRTRRRFHVDDHMRAGSTAKAFEGAIALRLVDAGRLSLDDTVAQRVSGMPASWGPVTLRQLLHHTSGLPNFTASPGWQRALSENPRRYVAPRELIAFAAGMPLAFAPGSRYAYSNTDNVVAGLMVEEAAGSSYEGQLGAQVLGPLRLRETSLPSTFLMPAPYVHGYDPQSRGRYQDISEFISSSATWAAGGIVTTPADLNRFIRAWGGPRFVRSATRAAQLDFVPGAGEPPGPGRNEAGLAIFRYHTRCGVVLGHTGNFPGYTQFIASSSDGRRSIVVSANEQLDLAALAHPAVFRYMRAAFEAGACAALAR